MNVEKDKPWSVLCYQCFTPNSHVYYIKVFLLKMSQRSEEIDCSAVDNNEVAIDLQGLGNGCFTPFVKDVTQNCGTSFT